ncbi:hypothetical protein [Rhizobium leguminosarum]|uniref:hypothetical protein n=1 Tax=Rhizobium leguminosarum TaxID=384 RepID=UPI00144263C2|nr:hypothetical protein [Rhizobium leguminosarum]NKL98675.1 hypothetical protein [Rhizobium leguminosarum bv. viciae]
MVILKRPDEPTKRAHLFCGNCWVRRSQHRKAARRCCQIRASVHGARQREARHAFIYAFFSSDLLTLAAAQTFPCLELALRERIGAQFAGRPDKNGIFRPAMLGELLKAAKVQGLIQF